MVPAALIFDVDGTLAETEELHRQAFNETFAAESLPWNWDVTAYRRLLDVAGGKERIAHFLTSKPEDAERAARPDRRTACRQDRPLHRAGGGRRAAAAGRGAADPGGEGGRRAAGDRHHHQPAQCRGVAGAALGADAMALFDVIGAGDVVPAKKPSPDIYRLRASAAGAARPRPASRSRIPPTACGPRAPQASPPSSPRASTPRATISPARWRCSAISVSRAPPIVTSTAQVEATARSRWRRSGAGRASGETRLR